MRKMNKALALCLALAVVSTMCSMAAAALAQPRTIVLGVTPGVHEELAEVVKPIYEAKGYTLKIIVFSDYINPNVALDEGELDVNSYQHYPFLEQFCADRKVNLVKIGNTFIFPMGATPSGSPPSPSCAEAQRWRSPTIPQTGPRISATGDCRPDQAAGWRRMESHSLRYRLEPLGLRIVELEAAQIPRALDDVDLAFINTNYAMEAGYVPARDAVFLERADSPWVNILAVKAGRENDPALLDLVEAYQSEAVVRYVESKYPGSLVPGF